MPLVPVLVPWSAGGLRALTGNAALAAFVLVPQTSASLESAALRCQHRGHPLEIVRVK